MWEEKILGEITRIGAIWVEGNVDTPLGVYTPPENSMECMTVTLAMTPSNSGDTEPELTILFNQARPEEEGLLRHKPSCKTSKLQFILTAECSETRAQHNCHQSD